MNFIREVAGSWWFKVLLIGLVIRLILMPFTVHPDLWQPSFIAYFFAYKGQINIYDYLLSLPNTNPYVMIYGAKDLFIYPPLAYFTLGIFRFLVKPFADPNFLPWLMSNLGHFYDYSTLGLQLFLFKFPYLFVDIGCAFLLGGLFDDYKKKKLAFTLWMFNPVTIYATFMMGQFDILPVFFTILSCYLFKKDKIGWGLISLGVGGAYKMYPLLLVPAAAFFFGRNFWDKIKFLTVGFTPYIITIIPFLGSSGFRTMVLTGSKETKMLFMNWPVTAAEGIFPFVLLIIIIYLISYYKNRKLNVEVIFLSIVLMLLSVMSYHPQWFLWVTPFLIWALVNSSLKYIELVVSLFAAWLIITLLFEASLSYGLFTPIWHNLVNAPSLSIAFSKVADVFQFRSIIRSIFAGASLFYLYRLYSDYPKNA